MGWWSDCVDIKSSSELRESQDRLATLGLHNFASALHKVPQVLLSILTVDCITTYTSPLIQSLIYTLHRRAQITMLSMTTER
jgi:hypothetical protein